MSRGQLIVISGPSGVGKTTVAERLLKSTVSTGPIERVITCTTRPPREGEVDGRDYQFLTQEEFERGIEEGRFLEHANVHGRLYGTPRQAVEQAIEDGKTVLLNIDVQGAETLRGAEIDGMRSVFLMPPDPEELNRRLALRSTDDAEEVARRLITAKNEMEQRGHYDHIVVNDDLDATVQKIKELITASAKKADPGTDCNSEPELREV